MQNHHMRRAGGMLIVLYYTRYAINLITKYCCVTQLLSFEYI
uniref:Uncharacterized protein n=1 Tax=Arundo donax TaxID=35708 RepID=A0A0A9GNP6_ARUDO